MPASRTQNQALLKKVILFVKKMVSFYRKVWFWLLLAGMLTSIAAVFLYITNTLGETTAYIVGAVGALLVLGGGVAGALSKEKQVETQAGPVTSEAISTPELTKVAAMLTGTTEAELDLAIEQQLARATINEK